MKLTKQELSERLNSKPIRKFEFGGSIEGDAEKKIKYSVGDTYKNRVPIDESYTTLDKSKVSSNYLNRFPNIQHFIPSDSKLGSGYYSKSDSAIFTPALTKLNKISTKLGEDTKNINNIVENISSPGLRFFVNGDDGKRLGSKIIPGMSKQLSDDNTVKEINNKITTLPDEELVDLLNLDVDKIKNMSIKDQIIKALKLKPSNVSYLEAYKYYNYLESSPLNHMTRRGINSAEGKMKMMRDRENAQKVLGF
jgi:hypothetical protein